MSNLSKTTLVTLSILVAVGGAFVGLVYSGRIPLERTTTQTQLLYITQYYATTQSVTQTVTQQIGRATSTTASLSGSYVLVTYRGIANSTYYSCSPSSGDVFLAVKVTIENHGYASVFVSPLDFYVIVGNQQYPYSIGTYSCIGNGLSSISVLNGLSVTGWLLYEVPADYGTFSLLWNHPNSVSVQYIQQ